jgi:tRNA 2-thiouridine synthesizing protein D
MVKISVMIFDAPYGHEKPYTALRFALTALLEGHEITIVLIQDGIYVGKIEQNPNEYPNHLEYVENIISEGGRIIVCGVCCKSRGIKQEELLNGAKIVGMHEIVQAVTESDKHISF